MNDRYSHLTVGEIETKLQEIIDESTPQKEIDEGGRTPRHIMAEVMAAHNAAISPEIRRATYRLEWYEDYLADKNRRRAMPGGDVGNV